MATEKQIIANRRNAELSCGPRTDVGKKVSRMNALRHGLTGQIEVTTPEEKEAKDKFCGEIESSLAPEGGLERQIAHSIAEDHWRLNRAKTIENNIFTLACSFQDSDGETESPEIDHALADARTFVADPARFQLLTIYERRIHSNMSKSLKQLLELQAIRRAAVTESAKEQAALRAQALEEARLITQLDEREGTPCDPAGSFTHPNGFVISNAEILQTMRYFARLKTARETESASRTPPIRRAA